MVVAWRNEKSMAQVKSSHMFVIQTDILLSYEQGDV